MTATSSVFQGPHGSFQQTKVQGSGFEQEEETISEKEVDHNPLNPEQDKLIKEKISTSTQVQTRESLEKKRKISFWTVGLAAVAAIGSIAAGAFCFINALWIGLGIAAGVLAVATISLIVGAVKGGQAEKGLKELDTL